MRSNLDQQPESAAWQRAGPVAARRLQGGEAIDALTRELELQPDFLLARNQLTVCLSRLGRHEEALAHCETALRLQPDDPHAHFNRAQLWLGAGRYREGWLEYEWRWKAGQCPPLLLPRPRWDGTRRGDQSILIHTEQGLGDTIQFIRLLPAVRQRCGCTLMAGPKSLRSLLSRCPGIDEWMPTDKPADIRFDLYSPLLSLPGLLQIDETNLPNQVPYIFPDPSRVERWRPVLATMSGLRVGICWQGSPTYDGDALRSIPLEFFSPLGQVPNVSLISLQKGPGSEQAAPLRGRLPVTVLDGFDETGNAFVDAAAVMQHLDLVVTSDTAIAHLAGALGIPVWVALSTAADWRWLRDRADSPWYPTMRLFRQGRPGDWAGVFGEIAAALHRRTNSPTAQAPVSPSGEPLAAAEPAESCPSVPVRFPRRN